MQRTSGLSANFQWLLNWLLHKLERSFFAYQLEIKKPLLMNDQVVIRVKVTKCEQTLLFIAMHYRGIGTHHWRSKIGEDHFFPSSFLITSMYPATSDFHSSISVKALLRRYHPDLQGLLHQQFLPTLMIQH